MNPPFLYVPTLVNFPAAPYVVLTWTDTNSDEDNYLVERSPTPGSSWLNIAILGANVVTYTDTAVTFGDKFMYRVRAFKNVLSGEYSSYSPVRAIAIPLLDTTPGIEAGGVDFGIQQFYGPLDGYHNATLLNKNSVFVNNYMRNNGLGNLDPDVVDGANVTIDNPASDSIQVRRGVIIVP